MINFLDRVMYDDEPTRDDRVDLTDDELKLYRGCGPAIAYTDNGTINKFIYLDNTLIGEELQYVRKQICDAIDYTSPEENKYCYFGILSCLKFRFVELLDAVDGPVAVRVIESMFEIMEEYDGI